MRAGDTGSDSPLLATRRNDRATKTDSPSARKRQRTAPRSPTPHTDPGHRTTESRPETVHAPAPPSTRTKPCAVFFRHQGAAIMEALLTTRERRVQVSSHFLLTLPPSLLMSVLILHNSSKINSMQCSSSPHPLVQFKGATSKRHTMGKAVRSNLLAPSRPTHVHGVVPQTNGSGWALRGRNEKKLSTK